MTSYVDAQSAVADAIVGTRYAADAAKALAASPTASETLHQCAEHYAGVMEALEALNIALISDGHIADPVQPFVIEVDDSIDLRGMAEVGILPAMYIAANNTLPAPESFRGAGSKYDAGIAALESLVHDSVATANQFIPVPASY